MMRSTCLCLVLICFAGLTACQLETPEVIATSVEGQLLRDDYESWRRVEQLEDGPDAIREYIFVQSMAARARKPGTGLDLRIKLENEVARRKLLSKALRTSAHDAITVSDEEIEKFRLQYPEAFIRPRKLMLRSIYKKLGEDPKSADEVRAQMEDLREQVLGGSSFGELARRESESQSRFQDGRLGFVDPDELPPGIAEAVRGLVPGKLSELIEADGAVMLFYCEKAKEGETPGVDEVRAKLRSNLVQMRKRDIEQTLGEYLLESADVEINPASKGSVLRVGEYRLGAEAFHELMAIKVPGSTPSDWDEGARRKLLRNWAIGVLEEQRAIKLGVDKSASTAEALRWLPMKVAARAELVRRIDAELKPPGDEEMRRYFEKNLRLYRMPERTGLRVIGFGNPPMKDVAAARQLITKAQEVERQIKAGTISFSDAARLYSTAPSASRGGDAGTQTRWQIGSLGSLASKAIAQCKPGESTDLLRLQSGLWMFEVRDRQPARPMTFAEARDEISRALRKQQVRELEAQIRDKQLAILDIRIARDAEAAP